MFMTFPYQLMLRFAIWFVKFCSMKNASEVSSNNASYQCIMQSAD